MPQTDTLQIPLPPLRYRYLVGLLEEARFNNPTGELIYPDIPVENYDAVFDFGCGCGRLARLLLLQNVRPRRYLGVDINSRMIEWCANNLTPFDSNFNFEYHDVFNPLLGQFNTKRPYTTLPGEDASFSLFLAYSVFTHLLPEQTEFYISEMSRLLKPGGIACTSWFFFDKRQFPMLQDFQNAMYINLEDPTNAVIYDRVYFEALLEANGLRIIKEENDFQTNVYLVKIENPEASMDKLPEIELKNTLTQYQERPSIPRSMDNSASAELDFVLPEINSSNHPELLEARLVTKDSNLIEEELFAGEMTPVVFELENSGKAAWLTNQKQPILDVLGSPSHVRIQVSWQHVDLDSGEANDGLGHKSVYGKIFLELPQVTPVLPGQLLTVPLLLYTPTRAGNYLFSLSLTSGEQEWPGEPLYTQLVQVVNVPKNVDTAHIREKELKKVYYETEKARQEAGKVRQEVENAWQAVSNQQKTQLSQALQEFAQAQQAFSLAQEEIAQLKNSYQKLESWATSLEQQLNRVPAIIRKASSLLKRGK